jgi:multicomponent Na+:H+ antiporter subunit D
LFLNALLALGVLLTLEDTPKLQTILLVGMASLNGMILTGDLFNLFIFLEISSIVAYLLVAGDGKYREAFNYFIIGTVGAGLYLLGIVILYSQFGTLNMEALGTAMIKADSMNDLTSVTIPIIFIFVGIGVEVKLFPLNGWVKGVLGDSKPLLAMMISSVYAGVMLMVFGRLFVDVLLLSDQLKIIFTIVAVITIASGELAAFASKKLSHILLYSSIAQSGLAVLLFINGMTSLALLVIAGNVVTKFIMFILVAHFKEGGSDHIDDLSGLFRHNPLNGLAFSIAGLSLIGLPMFYGFFVKVNILVGLFEHELWWVPIVILSATLIEGVYVLRMLIDLWNPSKEGAYPDDQQVTKLVFPIRQYVCMTVLLLSFCLVILGLFPSQMVEGANEAGNGLRGSISTTSISEKGGH